MSLEPLLYDEKWTSDWCCLHILLQLSLDFLSNRESIVLLLYSTYHLRTNNSKMIIHLLISASLKKSYNALVFVLEQKAMCVFSCLFTHRHIKQQPRLYLNHFNKVISYLNKHLNTRSCAGFTNPYQMF